MNNSCTRSIFFRSIVNGLLSIVVFISCAEFGDVFNAEPQSSAHAIRREMPRRGEASLPKVGSENQAEIAETRFIWPVEGRLTSLFGRRRGREHDGIDIVAPKGTPIYSAADGRVIYAGRIRGYGNLVIIKHAGNYFTAYGHLSQTKVSKGQRATQGMLIGNVGRTGRASAHHLHFEIRKRTKAVNPVALLPAK